MGVTQTKLWVQCVSTLLFFLLGSSLPAQAQVQEASRPLVPKYLNRMLQPLPSDKVAYLVVTAGGASTDVLLVASPDIPPPRLVEALRTTIAATPLRSQPIEWSAPTDRIPWVAAHAALRQGRIGAWQAQNTVPFGAFFDGLHRGGFKEFPNLHLPVGVFCSGLPPSYADFNGDRWYYLGKKAHPRAVYQVSAAVAPSDLLPLLLPLILIPVVGLAGQAAAVRWAGRRDPSRQNRKRFDLICSTPPGIALVAWMLGTMFSLDKLRPLNAINDIWFGRVGSSDLFPGWFILVLMVSLLTFWNSQRLTVRRYGPQGSVPVEAMSSGERSLRERESLWAAAVPLVMAASVLVLLFGSQSWLSGMPPWAAQLAVRLGPVLLLVPLAVYFSRKRKVFTTLTPDGVLTDTVRSFVAAPGLPPVEVAVEQSARAATYPFVQGKPGGQIVVSQKLTEIATPEQMRFLLAAQSVLGRTRDWSTPVTLLTVLGVLGGMGGAMLLTSHGLFPAAISLMLLLIAGMFVSVGLTARQSERRLREADQEALRLTNNRQAALEALELLRRNAMPLPSGRPSQASLQIKKRIAALEKENAVRN